MRPTRHTLIALAPALALACPIARADEPAAQVLRAVRNAYRHHPIDEFITIEVRGEGDLTDSSEGRLWMDLRPSASHSPAPEPSPGSLPHESTILLDLTLGPVRTLATPIELLVFHATDPQRFVGRAAQPPTLDDLEALLPAVPLPQIALALGEDPGDRLRLASLVPDLPLTLIAQNDRTLTLTGSDGRGSATLIVDRDTWRVQRFEATVPAPSGWYDLVVTATPIEGAPPSTPPNPAGRERVTRVADLRPRGLVLVAGAELGWLPVAIAPGQAAPGQGIAPPHPASPVPLGQTLNSDRPTVLAFIELSPDLDASPEAVPTAELVQQIERASHDLASLAPSEARLLLLFDPTGRRSATLPRVAEWLARHDLRGTPWAWVDGRTVSLSRSLPRLDPALGVVSPAGLVLDVGTMASDDPGRSALLERLRVSAAGAEAGGR